MRRVIGCVLLLLMLVLLTGAPAMGQARDPFRPPAGAGSSQGGQFPVPDGDGTVVEPPSTGGLPRTGQDLVLPFAAALAFIAAGGALRLTGRLLAV